MRTSSFFLTILSLLASATITYAQNANQAAVDTLTKEVAKAVFANINQPKAQEIYDQLLTCGESCDPQTIIRTVGGWDAVGAKMEELAMLKNTAAFAAMASGEANAAIRKQLAQFYARYKSDKNYGKPLSPAVQLIILRKIDGLLPPNPDPEPATTVASTAPASEAVAEDSANVDPTLFRMGKLERELKEKEENDLWTMILSAIGGLLVGGGVVYLLLYRAAQAEIKALQDENDRLRNSLETARRNKSGNEGNVLRSDPRQKAAAYDAIVAELGTNNPLMSIRQLKQQVLGKRGNDTPAIRSSESVVETNIPTHSEPIQAQAPMPPLPPLEPLPPLSRSEVFYFPPPDPNGQFDLGQKSSTLLPESAYRFSVNGDNPSVATFRFEADPGRVTRFLTYRNYMIEPACESENSYSSVHTRIAMRRDGEAVLENGVWRVKTKALIRLRVEERHTLGSR